jgi:lipooligosaccharide transport system permease protein
VFGLQPLTDLTHVAALTVFAGVMWLLAVRRLRARLVL